MDEYKIYIVEDSTWYSEILAYHLSLNPSYKVTRVKKAKECLAKMYLKQYLGIIDFSLPDMQGDELFKKKRYTISRTIYH